MEGSTNDIKASTWYAILDMLRNAFIQALTASVENEISIKSVEEKPKEEKGFFKKLFGSDDKKDKDKQSSENKKSEKKKD